MLENNRKDILPSELECTYISLLSNKIKVIVIGGGRAGYIKSKSFANKGCEVFIVSEEFTLQFEIIQNMPNVHLIKSSYDSSFILDKHLVVIAVNAEELNNEIIRDCENNYKLYLNCSSFKEGMFITPIQRETKNITFSLHTKGGGPRTSLFLSEIVKNKLTEYDDFTEYVCNLRDNVKKLYNKDEIMYFTTSEDFMFFYEKGKHNMILKMFYEEDINWR